MTGRRQDAVAARGFVTTTVALLMLLVVSVLVFYVNKGIWLEQRTSINQYQAKQAFNAAEAGLEYVLSALNATATTVSPRRSTYLTQCPINLQPDTCQPGTFTIGTSKVTGSPSAGQAFSVRIEPVSGDSGYVDRFLLTATGGSDCTTTGTMDTCSGRAVVSQIVELTPVLLSPPDDATSVYGATQINGNAARLRNAEGVGYPLRTGSTLSFSGGAGSSVLVSSLTAGSCTGSNKAMCNGFTSLASSSAFFSSFFGATPGDVQAMTTAVTSGAGFSSATSGLVWYTGDLNLNSDLGTTTNPILLVVNGNLTFNGNRDIVGFVYVTGNLTISGASSIQGAVAAAGNTTVQGNVDIAKDTTVLNQLKASASSFNKVPGTWRDWTP